MPSSSPPPPPPPPPLSPPQPLVDSSKNNTPRFESTAAFPRLAIAAHSTSAESSPSNSPRFPLAVPHATTPASTSASGALGILPSPIAEGSSTARARRATVSDAVASSTSTHLSHPTDIEMDPITPNPAGHRRRRSSLMSPASSAQGQPSGRGAHTRGPSVSGQFHTDEPKISEESQSTIKDKNGVIRHPANVDFSDEDLHDDEETGLTTKERRRKQKKKRRNTLLDQRIARDNVTAEEKKEADQTVVRKLAVNGTLIGLWYLFSLGISLYNKWMFDSSRLNFPFPLFTTSVHMLVQFTLASLVLYFVPSLRPQNAQRNMQEFRDPTQDSQPEKPLMTKMFYLTRIGPCGAATGLDIGLGNTSLKFITLTFYTMCKSSSLAFVLIFAFMFRLESPTWKLVGIIATMTAGVVMMVAGEVEFDLAGFVLVISAAFFSGFRWGLTQILLLRNPATSNPFSSIFFLAPVMFLTLICIAIPTEGFFELVGGMRGLVDEWGFAAPLLVLFPGTIAFLMTASEFALLQRTSVVTLSIAGIFKEVVTISTATLVFDDKLTPVNISGLFITIGAICAYNYIKITKMRADAQTDVHGRRPDEDGDMTSPSSSGTDVEDEGGEETGLLAARPSAEVEQGDLVTVDGDFVFPPRQPQGPVRASMDERDKSDRQD
ncbi:hypothetical protein KVR01_004899 [Diaporthe batatas]|uniref:uncharacterized protein n=1 Tax=Diaporthe batatas TaxID=748121 RepID=UPI001D04FBF2|nr:uncharacterized protein KVR01_004899 [Diaporthe batatas]KAG8164624.1 hypothetical protein KVR01_004899 [Diaporthe batatas]